MKPAMVAAIFVCLIHQQLRGGEEEARRLYLEAWYLETAEKEPAKAAEAYRKAIDAKGSDRTRAMALLRLGVCLRTLGKDKEAGAAFEEVASKHAAEADIAARAGRYLAGKTDEAVAVLPIADPRLEVLSLLGDMLQSKEGTATRDDLSRFLGVLRLSSPEYVRDVVLAKHPRFGEQALGAFSNYKKDEPLPDADPVLLLTFSGIPELRYTIYHYLCRKRDRSVAPRLLEQLDSNDPDLRAYAAKALGALEVKEAAPKILDLLRKEDDQRRIGRYAQALGDLRYAPAVEAMAGRVARGQFEPEVVTALSLIGSPEALEALKPILFSEDSMAAAAWNRLWSEEAYARAAAFALESAKPYPILLALRELLSRIGYVRSMGDVLPKIGKFLAGEVEKGEESETKKAIDGPAGQRLFGKDWTGMMALRFSEQPCPRWIPYYLTQLRVRFRGGPPEDMAAAAPLFRSLLGTPLAEAAVLFFLDQWRELPDMIEILRTGDARVRAIALALAREDGPVELWIRIGAEAGLPLDVKLALIQEIRQERDRQPRASPQAQFDVEPWSPAILRLLEDPDPDAVLACLDLISPLGSSGTGGFRGVLRRLLAAEGDDVRPPAIRSAALATLASCGDLEGCLLALRDPVSRIRLQAAEALSSYDKAYEEAIRLDDALVQGKLLRELRACIDRITQVLKKDAPPAAAGIAEVVEQLQKEREAAARDRDAWARRLGALFGSKREEIRQGALQLLGENCQHVPAELGAPLALRAFKDPAAAIRRGAMDLLGQYGQWDALLPIWEELRRDKPELALEVGCAMERIDLIRSLRDHPDPEIRSEAAHALFGRATTKDLAQFIVDPDPDIRKQVAIAFEKAHDLKALSALLADEDPEVAMTALNALAGFSQEVDAAVASLMPRGEGFESLDVSKRKEIAASVAGWLNEKGDAVWIGKAKDLLAEAAEVLAKPTGGKEKMAPSRRPGANRRYLELSRRATQILAAVLPRPEAVEMLLSEPHVDADLAAAALAQRGLMEPLERLFAILIKTGKGDRRVTREILEVLVRSGLRDEIKGYAESRASRPQSEAEGEDGDSLTAALVGLVTLGEVPAALECLENSVRAFGFQQREYSSVILATQAKCPDGPAAFFDFVARHPEREKETSALVEAFKACRSAEGLKRCLRDLPAPPARTILDALLAIGDPEPVLEEALEGALWHEAAAALHGATGDWFGYFGEDWKESTPPKKRGFLSVGLPVEPGRGRAAPQPGAPSRWIAVTVDPDWRRAAVDAWRAALKKKTAD